MRFKEYEELLEASYPGNIGIMELIKFKQKANDKQHKEFNDHVKNKRHEQAWKVVQDVVREETKPDILPKSGAGAYGTNELANTYKKDTPGQNIAKFKDYKRTK